MCLLCLPDCPAHSVQMHSSPRSPLSGIPVRSAPAAAVSPVQVRTLLLPGPASQDPSPPPQPTNKHHSIRRGSNAILVMRRAHVNVDCLLWLSLFCRDIRTSSPSPRHWRRGSLTGTTRIQVSCHFWFSTNRHPFSQSVSLTSVCQPCVVLQAALCTVEVLYEFIRVFVVLWCALCSV